MFSPKITTTCLIGVAVESDCALAAIGLATVPKTNRADNEVAMYFCISTPPRRGRYLRQGSSEDQVWIRIVCTFGNGPINTEILSGWGRRSENPVLSELKEPDAHP